MSSDQFFDGGWCWMSHSKFNDGNAVPVKMQIVDGARRFYPCAPEYALECAWDARDAEWQMVRPPMADLQDAIKRDDLLAALQGLLEVAEARIAGGMFILNAEGLKRIEAARAAIDAAMNTESDPVCEKCGAATTAAPAKPYAYEFGRSNGDGTYSVVIERGDTVQTGTRSYESGPPRNPHPDHPVRPLYELSGGVGDPRGQRKC